MFLDGSALFDEKKALDLGALELDDIRAALAGYAPDKGKVVAHPVFNYAPDRDPPAGGARVLGFALDGAIARAGFAPAVTQTVYHGVVFNHTDYIAPLRDAAGASESEPAVGDERVKAYPVRTPLSRVLTRSAAGVVDVRARIDTRAGVPLPPGVDESAKAALRALRLSRGSRVNFLFSVADRDNRSGDRIRALVIGWAEGEGLTPGEFQQ